MQVNSGTPQHAPFLSGDRAKLWAVTGNIFIVPSGSGTNKIQAVRGLEDAALGMHAAWWTS